jgi:adenosylcobinamide-GDP ribazoletransferase
VLAGGLALAGRRLIGGHTGDVLGGIEQACELGVMLGVSAAMAMR